MSANKLCSDTRPETKQFFCFVGLVCLEEVSSSVFLTTVVHERTHFTHMANINLCACGGGGRVAVYGKDCTCS